MSSWPVTASCSPTTRRARRPACPLPPPGGERSALTLAPVRNVHELGRSNYADTFAGMGGVVDHVVDFGRDSDRLDARDVALIDEVIERFDADTDLVAVTGYSVGGRPGLEPNRRMALRRARRIRDALTAVGVPPGRVLVEGFWAEDPVPGELQRAAHVRLLRRLSS